MITSNRNKISFFNITTDLIRNNGVLFLNNIPFIFQRAENVMWFGSEKIMATLSIHYTRIDTNDKCACLYGWNQWRDGARALTVSTYLCARNCSLNSNWFRATNYFDQTPNRKRFRKLRSDRLSSLAIIWRGVVCALARLKLKFSTALVQSQKLFGLRRRAKSSFFLLFPVRLPKFIFFTKLTANSHSKYWIGINSVNEEKRS